jgi:hypothetical protein
MVESTMSYLAPLDERPYYYQYPPTDRPWRNTKGDRRTVVIHDARAEAPDATLDDAGFTLVDHTTAVEDLYDAKAIRERYYREMETLVARVTGASRVLAFDHNVRSSQKAERKDAERLSLEPVRLAHNDYTERSGPQRVRDLLGDDAAALLERRCAVINVWKPIRGPVETAPLAVCDARSIRPQDLVPTDLIYRDRVGEVYSLAYDPAHRWFYFPRMRADEAMLLKCYDSDPSRARFTAHSAFDDPTTPADAAPRESIEVRTLAFY